jgi:hypothetical protein
VHTFLHESSYIPFFLHSLLWIRNNAPNSFCMSTPNEPPEESAREFPLPGSFLEALHKRTKEDLLQKMNVTSVEVSYLQACRIFQKLQKDFDLNNAGVSFQPYSEQQPLPPKYFEKLIHGIERPTYIQTTFFESVMVNENVCLTTPLNTVFSLTYEDEPFLCGFLGDFKHEWNNAFRVGIACSSFSAFDYAMNELILRKGSEADPRLVLAGDGREIFPPPRTTQESFSVTEFADEHYIYTARD